MKKEDDPYTVTYDRAVELILEKRKANAERIIMTFDEDPEVQVLNGRWGPYIAYKGRNIRIPKDRDPKSFQLQEIHELAEKTPIVKKGRFGFTAKKAFVPNKAAASKKKSATATAKKSAPIKKAATPAKKAAVKKVAVKKAATPKKAEAPSKAVAKKAPVKKKAAVKKKK